MVYLDCLLPQPLVRRWGMYWRAERMSWCHVYDILLNCKFPFKNYDKIFALYCNRWLISEAKATENQRIITYERGQLFNAAKSQFILSYFSTISGGLNALAAVFLEDIIKPAYRRSSKEAISNRAARIISRVVGKCWFCLVGKECLI